LNCTVRDAVAPGSNVNGNVAPEIAKPTPVRVAALIVTVPVPVEDRISVWVDGELTGTLPNATFAALTLSVETGAANCRLKALELPAVLAVSVAIWELLTVDVVAVNGALLAPAGTITDAGTATAFILLAKAMAWPPAAAAAFKVTAQSVALPAVMEALAQSNCFTCGTALPVSLILLELFVVELVLNVS